MDTNYSKTAENVCRFTGKLSEFKVQLVGAGQYRLGKGILFLPDPSNEYCGQKIKILSWEDTADEISAIQEGTWISVFSTYTPNVFRGAIQDYFTVYGVRILKDG